MKQTMSVNTIFGSRKRNTIILAVGWNLKWKIFFILKNESTYRAFRNRLARKADLSAHLCLQPFVMCGVVKQIHARNPFLLAIQWREVLETENAQENFSYWVASTQINSSTSSSFSDVAAVAFLPLPFFLSPEPVSFILFTSLVIAFFEQLNVGCSFQIRYEDQPFSSKSFLTNAI